MADPQATRSAPDPTPPKIPEKERPVVGRVVGRPAVLFREEESRRVGEPPVASPLTHAPAGVERGHSMQKAVPIDPGRKDLTVQFPGGKSTDPHTKAVWMLDADAQPVQRNVAVS